MQVDIYWYPDENKNYWVWLCSLVTKALSQGYRVLVLGADAQQAEELDERLWTHPAHRFVPHKYVHGRNREPASNVPATEDGAADQEPALRAPVLIVSDPDDCIAPLNAEFCLLLNLSAQHHPDSGDFGRVAELLPISMRPDPDSATQTKLQYYRTLTKSLLEHDLSSSG